MSTGHSWSADAWVERALFDGLLPRVVGTPMAETAWRATRGAPHVVDLRPLDAGARGALANAVDALVAEARGREGAVAYLPPETAYAAALERLAHMLRGARVEPDASVRPWIHYQEGSPSAPDSPQGLDVIQVRSDGVLYFENRNGPWVYSATAEVSPDIVSALVARLGEAGFPAVAPFQRTPGGGPLLLGASAVPGAAGEQTALLPPSPQGPYAHVVDVFRSWSTWFRAAPESRGPAPGLRRVADAARRPDLARAAMLVHAPPRTVAPAVEPPRPQPAEPAPTGPRFPPPMVDVKGWPEAFALTAQPGHALGALLGLAVGDALGQTTRGQSLAAPRFPAPATGPITDMTAGQAGESTQMAAAIADLFWKVSFFAAGTLAARYLDWQPHAPSIDEAVAKALARVRGQVSAEKAGREAWEVSGRTIESNASLARTAIVGVLLAGKPEARRAVALTESAITHFDPRCQLACAALDAAIALGVTGRSSPPAMVGAAEAEARAVANELRARYPELRGEIDRAEAAVLADLAVSRTSDPQLDGDAIHLQRTAASVHVALRLAFWQLLNAPSWRQAVLDVVNRGGDAAANAAVTGALLGAVHGIDAVPVAWVAQVLRAPGPRTDQADFHPRGFLRVLARGFGVEHDPAAGAALAAYVATAFPEFRGSQDHGLGLDDDAPEARRAGIRVGGRAIEAWLRGTPGAGQARLGGADGTRAIASIVVGTSASPPAPPALTEVAAVAPLLGTSRGDDAHAALIEAEPAGAPLSTPGFPLRAKDAVAILAQLVAVIRASEASGAVLGGLRPETVYVAKGSAGAVVTGVLPRGEAWLAGSGVLSAGYAAPELHTGAAVSSKADVYSVAALMVFLTSRRSPLEVAATAGDATTATLPGILDKTIAAAVRAALHADPAQRPTAAELAASLTAAGVAVPPPPAFRAP